MSEQTRLVDTHAPPPPPPAGASTAPELCFVTFPQTFGFRLNKKAANMCLERLITPRMPQHLLCLYLLSRYGERPCFCESISYRDVWYGLPSEGGGFVLMTFGSPADERNELKDLMDQRGNREYLEYVAFLM
jgi:hypothetical protein